MLERTKRLVIEYSELNNGWESYGWANGRTISCFADRPSLDGDYYSLHFLPSRTLSAKVMNHEAINRSSTL